ncbi:hypothetical protein [Sulfurisphaera ohwakuensis]|uniref:ABC-type Co2+ transport system permease subunit n=1 Tax=Sulfurisphaera ohwakuensis TaxID=69656 RepID=A0A650CEQ4_SULOH|nr:hypothetical protein [Sulfurisphaera ohwakuensis]MBB5252775.1 ABC-type Co2+ transport system permease subunit [Sulfurisphaera ohwakuensis]QGR16284.1 hypothetical protein D1869_03015 [Sulfurisphaera ohwakuensis]
MTSKKWSATTWFITIGPLAVFLIITIWVAEQLEKFPGWQLVPYIAVPMAVVFLIIGAVFRHKWGKFIFG